MNGQPWIYIVLLGAVIVLFSRIKLKKPQTTGKTPSSNEMEETLEHFAAEIAEENERLLAAVSQMKRDNVLHTNQLTGRIDELEKRCYDMSQEMNRLAMQTVQLQNALDAVGRERAASIAVANYSPSAVESTPPEPESLMRMKERYPELFELYGQGKSIDVIAKKLGMNKGEVNLIVQLARQEEQARV